MPAAANGAPVPSAINILPSALLPSLLDVLFTIKFSLLPVSLAVTPVIAAELILLTTPAYVVAVVNCTVVVLIVTLEFAVNVGFVVVPTTVE